MRSVTAVADLHGNLPTDLPEADVLVVAGDVCPITDHDTAFQRRWLERELYPWMEGLPHPEVVWIAGNHDFVCERADWRPGGRGHYLRDGAVELAGLRFYGTPWVPDLERWAFYAPDEELAGRMGAIPGGTDVVVSHGPPRGYGDWTVFGFPVGSEALRDRLEELQPPLCVYGHIHEAYGRWRLRRTELANVSYVDVDYSVREDAAIRFEVEAGRADAS